MKEDEWREDLDIARWNKVEEEMYNRTLADQQEYDRVWPNHCSNCDGWGVFYSKYDPSPAGVSLSPGYMVDVEVCEKCIDQGICPRCGEHTIVPETKKKPTRCVLCEFELEKTDGRPTF